ncbi:hypothetical protein BT93_F0032 [Corymbia citriodora subsp. variegata]|nr:hypothetical protein BT93_F0032 [Corymbia citriodora subsp. variegata]
MAERLQSATPHLSAPPRLRFGLFLLCSPLFAAIEPGWECRRPPLFFPFSVAPSPSFGLAGPGSVGPVHSCAAVLGRCLLMFVSPSLFMLSLSANVLQMLDVMPQLVLFSE